MAKRKRAARKLPNLPGEEWALVEGTDDYYISNLGRFKRGEKLRKISTDTEGYCRVNIGHNKYRLHRLVAKAFVENPHNYPVVDHLDDNKGNNKWTNLEWVTQGENTRRAAESGLLGHGTSLLTLVLDEENNALLYKNQAECARNLDLPHKGINRVAQGKQRSIKGYRIIKLGSFEDRRDIEERKKDETEI